MPARATPVWRPTLARQAAFWTAAAAWVCLIAVWPYQHWHFANRSSLLGGIIKKAQQDPEWLYCLFAPPVVAWLVWRVRVRLRDLPLSGSWLGAPVVALAMFFFWFGYKVDTAYPGYVAGQLLALGLILLLAGREWLRHLFFPWLFLVFMWPMLPLENMLAVPLRMFTAKASAVVLDLVGIDVVREGTGLYSAADPANGLAQGDAFRLDVEDPCSGIRSLFALLMISALYGFLVLKTWGQRAVLFASAIPLAVVGNLARMVMLAVGCVWLGPNVAVGRNLDGHQEMSTFHLMAGLLVFAVALGGMFLVATLLEKRQPARKSKNVAPAATAAHAATANTWPHLAVAAAIMGAGMLLCSFTDTSYRVGPPGVTMRMPALVGGYVSASEESMTAREAELLNDDVQILRRRYDSEARRLWATVVLSGAEKRSLHSPDVCLPSQGWHFDSHSEITVDLGGGRAAKATLIGMRYDSQGTDGSLVHTRAINIYWYQGSDDTTCASYDEHVARTYLDAVFRNVNHRWALISFFMPLPAASSGPGEFYAEFGAAEELKAFIRALMPAVLVNGHDSK